MAADEKIKLTIAESNGICVAHVQLKQRDFPTDKAEALLLTVPGLKDHKCETGLIGGFVLCLRRGTTFAHVLEHLTIEMIGQDKVTFAQTVDGERITLQGVFTPPDLVSALERALLLLRQFTTAVDAVANPQSSSEMTDTPAENPQY